MTISPYQIDNVIKAYNKQSKTVRPEKTMGAAQDGRYVDVVSLSRQDQNKPAVFEKISYSLLDVLLKVKEK